MNKLIATLVAAGFALGSVAVLAADEDNPAYKMGMASQRQHDLQLIEGQATNQPAATAAETKEIKEAAAKARAAYASMSPEDKAMYKKGMRAQHQMDLQAQEAQATNQPAATAAETKALKEQKGTPKEIQNPQQRQKALKDTEKASGPGS